MALLTHDQRCRHCGNDISGGFSRTGLCPACESDQYGDGTAGHGIDIGIVIGPDGGVYQGPMPKPKPGESRVFQW
jgi:hypothetical protein